MVDKMLGSKKYGGIGLDVDIGTIGYFRDLRITTKAEKIDPKSVDIINKL